MDKLDALQNEESAVAWFYRMLRNAVIDHHRRSATRRRGLDAFARELDMHVTPESEVRSVICHCIGELAATLKPEYAEVLHRVEVDEMALNDYASEAGISAGNAAVRAFRAREALRKQVARSCGTCAEHGCLDCTCDASPAHFASKRDASRA
jgi:RNA polymerase sigma-70 factor (ECF subfamily)